MYLFWVFRCVSFRFYLFRRPVSLSYNFVSSLTDTHKCAMWINEHVYFIANKYYSEHLDTPSATHFIVGFVLRVLFIYLFICLQQILFRTPWHPLRHTLYGGVRVACVIYLFICLQQILFRTPWHPLRHTLYGGVRVACVIYLLICLRSMSLWIVHSWLSLRFTVM
jgi:hypothetical protein